MPSIGIGVGLGILGGGAPFNIGSLLPDQYLDAELSSFTLNGSKVAQWDDLSVGGTYDAAQGTDANRPILSASPDVVTFTKTSAHYLTMPVLPTPAAWYLLFVGTITASAAVQQVFVFDYGAGSTGAQLNTDAANNLILSHRTVANLTTASWTSATLTRREMGWDGSNLKYRENGGAWQNQACGSIAYSGAQPSSIGAYYSGIQPCEMSVRLWLLMARWPSAAELTRIGRYSVARFGV